MLYFDDGHVCTCPIRFHLSWECNLVRPIVGRLRRLGNGHQIVTTQYGSDTRCICFDPKHRTHTTSDVLNKCLLQTVAIIYLQGFHHSICMCLRILSRCLARERMCIVTYSYVQLTIPCPIIRCPYRKPTAHTIPMLPMTMRNTGTDVQLHELCKQHAAVVWGFLEACACFRIIAMPPPPVLINCSRLVPCSNVGFQTETKCAEGWVWIRMPISGEEGPSDEAYKAAARLRIAANKPINPLAAAARAKQREVWIEELWNIQWRSWY